MKKTFASLLLILTTALVACGSESGDQTQSVPPTTEVPPGTPPGPEKKPFVVDVVDPSFDAGTGEQDGGSTDDGGTTDPGDGGTDPDDGGTTDPTDGGTTDPTDGGSTDPTDGGTGGEQDGGVTPPPPPTSATVGGVQIDFVSQDGNTFCYQVTELDGTKDLSHWDLGTSCQILAGSPKCGFSVGIDPKSGIKGVKWDVSDDFESDLFCVTVTGEPTLGTVDVASKSGYPISFGEVAGPVCQ